MCHARPGCCASRSRRGSEPWSSRASSTSVERRPQTSQELEFSAVDLSARDPVPVRSFAFSPHAR
eukprot:4704009-Pyramimonas_sp.AAC.2